MTVQKIRKLPNIVYRFRQTLLGIRPAISAAEARSARALLTDEELHLFLTMDPRDRRHAMNVMRWLQGHANPSDMLLAAALLHDVGKGSQRLWHRASFTVLEMISPQLLAHLGSQDGARWQRALWTLSHHAGLGARILSKSGTQPPIVALVAKHTDRSIHVMELPESDLEWLIIADNAC